METTILKRSKVHTLKLIYCQLPILKYEDKKHENYDVESMKNMQSIMCLMLKNS